MILPRVAMGYEAVLARILVPLMGLCAACSSQPDLSIDSHPLDASSAVDSGANDAIVCDASDGSLPGRPICQGWMDCSKQCHPIGFGGIGGGANVGITSIMECFSQCDPCDEACPTVCWMKNPPGLGWLLGNRNCIDDECRGGFAQCFGAASAPSYDPQACEKLKPCCVKFAGNDDGILCSGVVAGGFASVCTALMAQYLTCDGP